MTMTVSKLREVMRQCLYSVDISDSPSILPVPVGFRHPAYGVYKSQETRIVQNICMLTRVPFTLPRARVVLDPLKKHRRWDIRSVGRF